FQMRAHDFQYSLIESEPGRAAILQILEQPLIGFPVDVSNDNAVRSGSPGHDRHDLRLPQTTRILISSIVAMHGQYDENSMMRFIRAFAIAATLMTTQTTGFEVQEATIADIHAALASRRITCAQLVQKYLDRIEAYDKKGPAINSVITVNAKALDEARAIDVEIARAGITKPLQFIPVAVKDNFQTIGLPTTAGSLSLSGWMSNRDAFQVKKMREAGAIIIAKTNMAEFAWSPVETVGSMLPGYTRNPYSLNRVTAGSSGGTAAAVASSFAAVGLGTDTGNSIRGPSSHNDLVGIRSTMGLTSRSGIVPLNLMNDIAGPMARTVADAVKLLDVVAGYDPDDPVTEAARTHKEASYSAALVGGSLKGARIGVARFVMRPTADPDVVKLF